MEWLVILIIGIPSTGILLLAYNKLKEIVDNKNNELGDYQKI